MLLWVMRSAGLTRRDRPARPDWLRGRRRRAAAEQAVEEERRAAREAAAAAAEHRHAHRQRHRRAAVVRLGAIDRDVGHAAVVALERGERLLVAAVDVLADL